jgi:hypothetical protein
MTGPALQVVRMVQESAVFRWMIEQDSYLLTLLIAAAEAAAKSSDLERFFEVLACAICTSERGVEVTCNGSPAELEEIKRLNARASEDLGVILRELCPDAHQIGGAASSSPASN